MECEQTSTFNIYIYIDTAKAVEQRNRLSLFYFLFPFAFAGRLYTKTRLFLFDWVKANNVSHDKLKLNYKSGSLDALWKTE